MSKGGIPVVLFSNGKTWLDSRRTSLHVLRDFGFGKNMMEEMIDDELNKLVQYIDDQWLNSPLDVSQFFNISVLSSLWRIISGESLEIHDSKLSSICKLVQVAIQEAGNPFQVSDVVGEQKSGSSQVWGSKFQGRPPRVFRVFKLKFRVG